MSVLSVVRFEVIVVITLLSSTIMLISVMFCTQVILGAGKQVASHLRVKVPLTATTVSITGGTVIREETR